MQYLAIAKALFDIALWFINRAEQKKVVNDVEARLIQESAKMLQEAISNARHARRNIERVSDVPDKNNRDEL